MKFVQSTKATTITREDAMAAGLTFIDGNYKAVPMAMQFLKEPGSKETWEMHPVKNRFPRKKWNIVADKFCKQDEFPSFVAEYFAELQASSIYKMAKDRMFMAEQNGDILDAATSIHKARWTCLFSGVQEYVVYTHNYSDTTEGVIKWCLTHGVTVHVIDMDNNRFTLLPVRDLTRSPWYQTWAVDSDLAFLIMHERNRIEKEMWVDVEEAMEPWKNAKWLHKTEDVKTKLHWSQFFELQETQYQWFYAGDGAGKLDLPAGYASHEDFINTWGPAFGIESVRVQQDTNYLTYREYIPGRNVNSKPRYLGNGDWAEQKDNVDFPIRSFINKKQVQAQAKNVSTPAEIFNKYCELCWFLTQPNSEEYMDAEYVRCNSCGKPFHQESADPCVKRGICPHCGQLHGHDDLLSIEYRDFLAGTLSEDEF